MNAPFDPSFLLAEKFAVGQPVSRKEDPVLLRGQGRYTDDLNRPGQLYGVMVRSRVAHGVLRGLDTGPARALPGVHAVISAAELDAAGTDAVMTARVPGPQRAQGQQHQLRAGR
jgi:aerobic carbon-monoxide dehydrogenase large subunit